MSEQARGRVILIAGPSSVGKTSVVRELQRRLPGLWLNAGVDLFWSMLDEARLPDGEFRTDSAEMRRITFGWHRAVAALAAASNDVIVDDLPTHRWWLDDWREVLAGFEWWSVLLMANGAVLAEREARRGDRPGGLASSDLHRLVPGLDYDLVLDTTGLTICECAEAVADHTGLRLR